jgi:tartrate dehydratase beta subunit/fumarate hydratase class I family protein
VPYIEKEDRPRVRSTGPTNAGELNFLLTEIVQQYFVSQGGRYQQINDIVGALEGAKLEFTRRVTNSYEDTKIKENGDVLHKSLGGE